MKDILVIYDKEELYVKRLMEFINKRKTWPFIAVGFTENDVFLDYLKNGDVDVILIDSDLYVKELDDLHKGLTFILDKGGKGSADKEKKYIYKYQSAEDVLREILDTKSQIEEQSVSRFGSKKVKKEIVGVYSPGFDSLRDVFSLAFAQVKAETCNVLFLDLSWFSGIEKIFDLPTDRGISELLYYAEQKRGDIAAKLGGMTGNRCGFDIVPGVSHPCDLNSISAETIVNLLGHIERESAYDLIVIDMSVPSFEVMDICSFIYMPSGLDHLSELKAERFLKAVEESRYQELLLKIEKVCPPLDIKDVNDDFFGAMLYGNFGQWLRETIESNG